MIAGSVGRDGKVHCPHCNSVQVKKAKNQPRKYPKPSFWAMLAHKEGSTKGATGFYHYGYDCKKCGSEFLVPPVLATPPSSSNQPLPSPTTPAPRTSTPKKKKGGFLWKLTFLVLLIFAGLVAWGMYDNQHKSTKHKSAKSDSIEKSQDMSDTLKITETRTNKEN